MFMLWFHLYCFLFVIKQVDEWVAGLQAVAQAKTATLLKIAMPGLQLPADRAAHLINSLPSIHVDLCDGAVSAALPGAGNVALDPSALVRSLNLARNTYYVLQWWTSFPRLLVELDLSDTQNAHIFDALLRSVDTLKSSIALQKLSVARLVVAGNAQQQQLFQALLQALLMSDLVRLKSLDITGTYLLRVYFPPGICSYYLRLLCLHSRLPKRIARPRHPWCVLARQPLSNFIEVRQPGRKRRL